MGKVDGRFGTTSMQFILAVTDVLQGYVVKWMLVSIYLEIVLIMTQDRCMVCSKRTTGSEISLDTPNCTPM
jgi:hypothetical protein